MDAINDYYMEELDLLAMKRFFWEQGERRILEKQDYFVRQGERSGRVAYVEDGMFRFVRTDTKGCLLYTSKCSGKLPFCRIRFRLSTMTRNFRTIFR